MEQSEFSESQINGFFDAVNKHYGYDFREYAEASRLRRIRGCLMKFNFQNLEDFQQAIIDDPHLFKKVLSEFTVTVTEMFRDPPFFKSFKEQVVPYLRTYPVLKIWHAGCSTGEEVYSLAIFLEEEKLLERSIIYATDINPVALEKAKLGVVPTASVKKATGGYFEAGGAESLSHYFNSDGNSSVFKRNILEKICFSNHSLVSDGVFGEMNVIICRNVMIYFKLSLQTKALKLFGNSLCHGGFLCLGNREAILNSELVFEIMDARNRIYRKALRESK